MEEYTKYNVEDFASDDSFIGWVNHTDPESEKFWSYFVLTHPELKVKIDQARTLVINLKRSQNIRYQEQQINMLWEGISSRIAGNEPVPSFRTSRPVLTYTLASLLFLFTIAGVYIFISTITSTVDNSAALAFEDAPDDFIEEINTTGHVVRVHLSDGSVVDMESNSKLRYKKDYSGDSTRHVYLLGEAFFDVAKNPYKPFFVHSSEIVTEVIGTSFRVQAREQDKNVTVSVKTGKVSVYSLKKFASSSDQEKSGVILLPNQQVMYRRQEQSFDKKLVEKPEILSALGKKSDFVFDNTPVPQVFDVLQEAYGIEIIFNEEIMSNCFITAPLGAEPLFEKLRIICQTIGASYEIVDAKVIITSSGC